MLNRCPHFLAGRMPRDGCSDVGLRKILNSAHFWMTHYPISSELATALQDGISSLARNVAPAFDLWQSFQTEIGLGHTNLIDLIEGRKTNRRTACRPWFLGLEQRTTGRPCWQCFGSHPRRPPCIRPSAPFPQCRSRRTSSSSPGSRYARGTAVSVPILKRKGRISARRSRYGKGIARSSGYLRNAPPKSASSPARVGSFHGLETRDELSPRASPHNSCG